MPYWITKILNFSLFIPAVLALIKFKTIPKNLQPFLFFIWTGCFFEVLGMVFSMYYHTNAVSANFYILISCHLLLFQFRQWGLFHRFPQLYPFLAIIFTAIWMAEHLVFSSLQVFTSVFRISYSFVISFLSIISLYKQSASLQPVLYKNPIVLISLAFLLFFSVKLLIEIFWLFGVSQSSSFRINLFNIVIYANLLVNILYIIAVQWIPRKQTYTWLS